MSIIPGRLPTSYLPAQTDWQNPYPPICLKLSPSSHALIPNGPYLSFALPQTFSRTALEAQEPTLSSGS